MATKLCSCGRLMKQLAEKCTSCRDAELYREKRDKELNKDLNMESTCKCGQQKMFGSWMCKTCHAQYMKTGVDPSSIGPVNVILGSSAADYARIVEAHQPMYFEENEPELETSAKPQRYNQSDLEYWDAVNGLGWNYFQGATGKYIHRYHDKNGPEDLVKAINYCIKMISIETGIDYYELHKLTPEQLGQRIKK